MGLRQQLAAAAAAAVVAARGEHVRGTAAAVPAHQPVPSAAQNNFTRSGISMFMHFGPCTFVGCQWDTQLAPPSLFAPSNLSTDQWFDAARLLGADEVCLTARHVDGFTLWPSSTTNYSVASSPWRNGAGDVVADFVASAARAGIRACLYIILGFNIHANKTGVPGPEYLQQQQTALTELLTRYADPTKGQEPIVRLWWDNYALDGATYQPVTHEGFVCPGNVNGPACPAWDVLTDTVARVSPTTVMVPGRDGCLVNAETAGGTYPLYRAAKAGSYWCTAATAPQAPDAALTFQAVEADWTILNPGDNWFWNPGLPVVDVGTLWSQLTLKWGQGASVIVNVPPDTTGQVPQAYMDVLSQFHAVREATYGAPVAALQQPASGACPGLSVTVPVDPAAAFDQVWLEEDLAPWGQVVGAYTLEAQAASGGGWTRLTAAHGKTVGARVLDWGLGTLKGVSALRWNCTAPLPGTGAGVPATLRKLAAYLGAPLPAAGGGGSASAAHHAT